MARPGAADAWSYTRYATLLWSHHVRTELIPLMLALAVPGAFAANTLPPAPRIVCLERATVTSTSHAVGQESVQQVSLHSALGQDSQITIVSDSPADRVKPKEAVWYMATDTGAGVLRDKKVGELLGGNAADLPDWLCAMPATVTDVGGAVINSPQHQGIKVRDSFGDEHLIPAIKSHLVVGDAVTLITTDLGTSVLAGKKGRSHE